MRQGLCRLFAVTVFFYQAQALVAAVSAVPLTRVRDIRSLTLADAKTSPRVRLRGVVTVLSGYRTSFFFQDATAGIAVDREEDATHVQAGDFLEIEGRATPGMFAPSVLAVHVKKMGTSPLPAGKVFSYERLVRGQQDSQWGEFVGVVHAARVIDFEGRRPLRLMIQVNGGTIETRVGEFGGADISALVDATVRVRGVFATNFNDRRQLIGVRSFVARLSDLTILRKAPVSAFHNPVRPINTLQQFEPGDDLAHQVKIRGTAIYQRPGHALYVQDKDSGIVVQTAQDLTVTPGETVEAVGFVSATGKTPVLESARFRVVAGGGAPRAEMVMAADVIRLKSDDFWSTPWDSRLVAIRGRVLDNVAGATSRVLMLRDGNTNFRATFEAAKQSHNSLGNLESGTIVQVTGVCSVVRDESGTPVSFEVMLRDPADVAVVTPPDWFSPERLLWVALLALALAVWKAIHYWQQQKSVTRELLRSRKRFQLFLDSSPSLSYIKDFEGRMVWINKSCEKLWNVRLSDWAGKSDFDLWPREIAEKLYATDRGVMDGGKPVEVLEDVPQPNGEMRHFVSTKFPFESGNGELMLGGTSIDITERVRMEALLRTSELRYRELFEHNPVAAWVYSRETRQFLDVNEAAIGQYGYSREEFLGLTAEAIQVPEEIDAMERTLAAGLGTDGSRVWRHIRKDGSVIRVELRAQPVQSGSLNRLLVMANDVTERVASEEKFRVLFEESSDAHLLLDETGVIDCNQAAVRMLRGESKQQLIGTALMRSFPDEGRSAASDRAKNIHALDGEGSVRFDCMHRRFDGTDLQVEVSLTMISLASRPMMLEVWHDLTERKERERQLAQQALTDVLTGLPNRRHFTERLTTAIEIAKQDGHKLSLCACDVDHFKQVNDGYGHAAGDDVLVKVGRLLRGSIRHSDFVARMGGDEFCILFPHSSASEARVSLARFQEQLAAHTFVSPKGASFKVTLTLGVAELAPDSVDEQNFVELADQALYKAKEQGRNRIVIDEEALVCQ